MPREDKLEVRVSWHKLLIGVLLTVVPISVVGLASIAQSDRALERTIGGQFKTLADMTAAEVSQFMSERVVDVGTVAAEPTIVDAVAAANRTYQGMNEQAVAARIQKIDKDWNTPAAEPMVKQILSSRASQLLRRHRDLDPRILRITVTDARGATVAASHKTLDYYQADEDYWQNIYAHGRGAISITDVLYDEATKSNYIGVGVPVLEEGSNRFIGTVDALVDVSSLFPLVNRAQLGRTSRTMLVKDNGTVISAPQINLAMKLQSDEYAAVQESLHTLQGRQQGYVVADVRNAGSTVIGFADTGLKRDYGNLGWVVLVCQDAAEAFAPVRAIERMLALMSLLGLVMVVFLSVYFAMHRHRSMTEIGDLRKPAGESPLGTASGI